MSSMSLRLNNCWGMGALHLPFCSFVFQVKAYGPGLQSTGLAVGKPAEFTVDAKLGGQAPLKLQAQVCIYIFFFCVKAQIKIEG